MGHHSLGEIVAASGCTGSRSRARELDVAEEISPRHMTRWPPIRLVAAVSYLVSFAAQCLWWGWPTDTLLIFGWLGAGALCWNVGQPWDVALRWMRDWGPVCAVLVGYDYSRGLAAHGLAPHITAMIKVDEFLAGGRLPTLWLQQHLYDPQRVHWWDVLASVIYLSHFVAVPGAAGVLWLRRRQMWSAFVRRWLLLAIAGVATYLAYPAAPPWWASVHGYLGEHVERLSARGWAELGLDSTGPLFNQGQALANPVAAMPSLHAAFSMFLAVFFLPSVPQRWRPLLLAYPLAMMFTVLYCAEHYVVDVLAGWAYVLAAFWLMGFVERRWQHNAGVTERGRHRRHTRRITSYPRPAPLTAPPSLSPVLVTSVGYHAIRVLAGHPSRYRQPDALDGTAASRQTAAALDCTRERHGHQVSTEREQISHPKVRCIAAGSAG